jgi:hypothetical protein
VRRPAQADDVAQFAREWNAALALVLAGAALLFAAGHYLLGAISVGLSLTAFVARRNAMRRQGRGFYGAMGSDPVAPTEHEAASRMEGLTPSHAPSPIRPNDLRPRHHQSSKLDGASARP